MEERETQTLSVSDIGKVPAEALGAAAAIPSPSPITYSCNGPVMDLHQDDFDNLVAALKPPYISPDAYAVLIEPNTFGAIGPVVVKGKQLLILRRPENQFAVRAFCGANLTELIGEVAEDGDVHEVTCPTCGTVATIRRTPPASTA
jgi:hypothetical protein